MIASKIPVSYTHLDVYKRQDLDCGHCADKIQNAVKKIDGVTSVSAVSYTHLDVYKRQHIDFIA